MAKRKPVLGPAFDAEQTNDAGRARNYAGELRYYRPRGFSKRARELEAIAHRADEGKEKPNDADAMYDLMPEAEDMLTSWAMRVERHEYIAFGPFEHNGCVGFYILADNALEDADIRINAGDDVPRGFSGMAVFVNDHGNVSAQTYYNGRLCRTLFDVV